jgi:hypothetical protein
MATITTELRAHIPFFLGDRLPLDRVDNAGAAQLALLRAPANQTLGTPDRTRLFAVNIQNHPVTVTVKVGSTTLVLSLDSWGVLARDVAV